MLLIIFLRNSFLFINNFFYFLQLFKTKSFQKFFLFLLFYLFINLYLFPTIALCEIDLELLNRENNTYKGSKIVYENSEEIVTQDDLKHAREVCSTVMGAAFIVMLICFPFILWEGLDEE